MKPPLGSTIEIDQKYGSCSGIVSSIIDKKDGGYDLIVILDYIAPPLRYVRIKGEEWEEFIEKWLADCTDDVRYTP